MAEKANEDLILEMSPDEMTDLMDFIEIVQEQYNLNQKVSDKDVERIAKAVGETKESILQGLEETRLDEIEKEKQRELEPSDEEQLKQWKAEEKRLNKLAEKGADLTPEEIEEICEFFQIDEEMFTGDGEEETEGSVQVSKSTDIVKNVSFFGMIIRAIKNLFK